MADAVGSGQLPVQRYAGLGKVACFDSIHVNLCMGKARGQVSPDFMTADTIRNLWRVLKHKCDHHSPDLERQHRRKTCVWPPAHHTLILGALI